MNLRIIFFVTIFFICNLSKAKITREQFGKAVDLLNCMTTELSLKKHESLQLYMLQCPCNQASYDQITSCLKSIGKLEATIALASEIESLKKSFKDNWKTEDAFRFLYEDVFADSVKYQKIFTFGSKRKDQQDFVDYRASLKKELLLKLEENTTQTNGSSSVDKAPTQEQNIVVTERQTIPKANKNWFSGITSQTITVSILSALLFSIVTLLLTLRFFERKEVPEKIKEYVRKKISELSESKLKPSGNQADFGELININKKIQDIELHIKTLNDQLNISRTTTIIPNEPSHFLQDVKPEVFFLSTPNSDGSFNASSASFSYREGASIYRFTKTSNQKARFQIDEKESSIKLALQYPDKNIDPVCEAENAFNPKATRIKTVQEGEAELQGDRWIQNTKARIYYES